MISKSALRARKGLEKFYCMMDLLSIDMDIYDSIVSFQKINAHHPPGP